ncbi:NTP transferase domain-containing protein [Nannocystis pusilla]|uniref:NTP transferase domain-containing protein n=1 Tax=Nannocystis pusilla TaxID=889268 RepID=UPI003B789119
MRRNLAAQSLALLRGGGRRRGPTLSHASASAPAQRTAPVAGWPERQVAAILLTSAARASRFRPCLAPLAVVLAAGKGTRMRSDLPKVLHPLAGEPLAVHVLRSARAAGVAGLVVVVGHGAEQVEAALRPVFADLRFALQAQQLGTGHAVQCALPAIGDHDGPVLILSGDVPLLRPATLAGLLDACASSGAGLALATFEPADPHGYGRIVRDDHGRIQAIVEERDADAATRAIRECNAGVYCASAELLRSELPALGRANAQGRST